MKQEIAKLWVEALRSGEFKQTKSRLETSEGNCCLGVLCRLANRQKIIPNDIIDVFAETTCFDGATIFLPKVVKIWAGMKTKNGGYRDNNEYNSLASLNDHGKTFNEIADTIETNWELL